MLVGWSSFAVVKGFWDLRDNIYECVCCYNRCHGKAVKGGHFSINMYFLSIKLDFPVILDGQCSSTRIINKPSVI
jgi:hypothetical protein